MATLPPFNGSPMAGLYPGGPGVGSPMAGLAPSAPGMESGLPPPAFPMPALAPPPPVRKHDVTVVKRSKYGCAKVMSVPPEEFGISRRARSVRDTTYAFHCVKRPEWELLAEGYDEDQIKGLPSATDDKSEEFSRDTVMESDGDADSINSAARMIEITEHYIRLDYEGDGKARLYKVMTGGEPGEILRRKDGDTEKLKDAINEVDAIPFASMTPFPVPHRFMGQSVADKTIDIQKQKTALLRQMLDNAYGANIPRPIVSENGMGDNTLDDLLTWRHGAPIRVRGPLGDAITWTQIPPIGAQVFPLIQYLDTVREWRTGVSRQGQGVDRDALQNQVATIANQMETASAKKMKLIARIFAETGIREMFFLLHGTIRKNDQQQNTVRLRGKWVSVDPRQWKSRSDMTINVGLGSGSKQEELQRFLLIVSAQEKAAMQPELNMVGRQHLWESAKELCRLTGYKGVERFFADPNETPPGQPKPDPKIMELQMKAQVDQQAMVQKGEIEKLQAQADITTNNSKVQADVALADRKFQHERELAVLEANLRHQERMAEIQVRQQQQDRDHAMRVQERAGAIEVKSDELAGPIAGSLAQLIEQLAQHITGTTNQQSAALMQAMSRPKRIVRDPKTNKVMGVETVG